MLLKAFLLSSALGQAHAGAHTNASVAADTNATGSSSSSGSSGSSGNSSSSGSSGSSGSEATAKVDQVVITFTWANLDYTKLDTAAKTGFTTDLKAAVLKTLPEGSTLAHIKVTLSAGSVVADVMITPLTGTTAAALTTTLSAPLKWSGVQGAVSTAMLTSESAKKALATGATSVGPATATAPAVAVKGVKPTPPVKTVTSSGTGAAIGVVSMGMVGLVASRF